PDDSRGIDDLLAAARARLCRIEPAQARLCADAEELARSLDTVLPRSAWLGILRSSVGWCGWSPPVVGRRSPMGVRVGSGHWICRTGCCWSPVVGAPT